MRASSHQYLSGTTSRGTSNVDETLESLRAEGVPPFWIAPDERFEELIRIVEQSHDEAGVVVPPLGADGDVTVISRASLLRELSKPYVRDLWHRKSVEETLAHWRPPTLILPATTNLEDAALHAINRENIWRYEPIVVLGDQEDDDYFLVEVHRLLTAQAKQVRRTRVQLQNAARLAGRAEVACGVIHNVGNALNSINVSVTSMLDDVLQLTDHSSAKADDQTFASKQLDSVVAMLRQAESDGGLQDLFGPEGRGRHLAGFLESLARRDGEQHRQIVDELRRVQNGVDHVRHIIHSQQGTAVHHLRNSVVESVDPVNLLEEALLLGQQPSDIRHKEQVADNQATDSVRLEIEVEDDLPMLMTDRHQVLEILGNYLSNARWAVSKAARAKKANVIAPRIIAGVRQKQDAGSTSLVFFVRDNGCGFSEQQQKRLFQHGFSLRSNGHGFGLHSCATRAEELGGSVHANSAGPGEGACFELHLPAAEGTRQPEPVRQAA
jgi:signal transduction histidine kinase